MAKIINLIFVLFLYTNALAQIGGTQAVEDTMRLADKFAVYKIALGQRLDASKANTDTIQVTALLDVPEGGLPTCNSSRQGNLMMNTSNNRLYFCNGSSWGLVAYDADLDGLTSAIDANEAVAFTAGTAAASNVMSGFTFYTGASMTETTGSIPTYGGALSNGGSISSGSYTPANFPFTLQTDDDYVDKDLTINNPTNLTASNVRVGVAIAGNTGTYPSAGNRLNGNTATTDVIATTMLANNEGFQSDGTLITGSIPTYGGSISNGGSISSGSYTPANFPFTLQTNDDYVDKDLTINNPTNLSASNVRIGVAIAGNTGTYPSAANRLNGNTGTTDIIAGAVRTGYEGFQSDGTLVTGSIPTYGGALSNGGSISSGSYTPANFPFTLQTDDDYVDKNLTINNPTNLAAANIKNGVTIAGVTGSYMNGSSNGLGDLYVAPGQPDSGAGRLENIYANQVPEYWGYYDRFGTLRIGTMPKFFGPLYSGAANLGLSGIDNDKYKTGNYVPNFSSGSYTINTKFIPTTYSLAGQTNESIYGRGSLVEEDIILKKDPNLVGSNILNTVSIFGVSGSIPTRGSQTFTSDGVKDAGYYSGITVDVVSPGTADADAGGAQIRSGYEAWNSTGGLVDGTMPDRGAGSFTADGTYTTNYDGYYSSITVNAIEDGTGTADAGDDKVRTGYEYWTSSGQRRTGTISDQGGGTYSAQTAASASSDLLATGGRYLTGDVRINRVTATATINQGETTSNGPWRSVSCNSVSVEAHAGISGAADTDATNVRYNQQYYGTSDGVNFSKKTGSMQDVAGGTFSAVQGAGGPDRVVDGPGYITGDVYINRYTCPTAEAHAGISGAADTDASNVRYNQQYYGTVDGVNFSKKTGSMQDVAGGTFSAVEGSGGPDLVVDGPGYLLADVYVNRYTCPTCPTCDATGFQVTGPNDYNPQFPPGTNIPSGKFIRITALGGSHAAAEYRCE